MLVRQAGGLHWVGLFLVAVAGLFVWATWRRLGESENPPIDVAALVWAALGLTRRPARWRSSSRTRAGRPSAGSRWRRMASASTRSAAGRRASSTSRRWRRSCRSRRSPCGGNAGSGAETRASPGSPSFGGLYAAAPSRCCGTRRGRDFGRRLSVAAALAHFLLCWYVLRGVATGTPWGLISIGARRCRSWSAPSGWRAGATRMTGATEALGYPGGGRRLLHRRRDPARAQPRMDHGGLCRSSSPPSRASPPISICVAMRRLCWLLLAVVDRALRAQSRGAAIPARRHADLQLDPVGLWAVDRGLRRRRCASCGRPATTAGARDRGGDRAAGLRAAHPRGAQRLPPRRHGRARRAVHGARVLCRWCGAPLRWPRCGWRARAAIRGPVGVAA